MFVEVGGPSIVSGKECLGWKKSWKYARVEPGGIACGMFTRKDSRKKWERNQFSSDIGWPKKSLDRKGM